MSNLKLVILLGFVFMFVAGLAVGRAPKTEPQKDKDHGKSWLGNELHLTPDQQKQMKAIWSSPEVTRPDIGKLCRDTDRQRDQAVLKLLTPEERQQFDQIKKDHDAKIAALFAEREQAMRDAEEKTRQMLTDEQRKKYEEILKAHGHHFGPQHPVHHHTRPTTGPSAGPVALVPAPAR